MKILLITLLLLTTTSFARNDTMVFLNDNPDDCSFHSVHDSRTLPNGVPVSTFALQLQGEGSLASVMNQVWYVNSNGLYTVRQDLFSSTTDVQTAQKNLIKLFLKFNGRGNKAIRHYYKNNTLNCVNR